MTTTYFTTCTSPFGDLLVAGDGRSLTALRLPERHRPPREWIQEAEPFAAAVAQLEEYFAGERTEFHLPLAPQGGEFDRAAWDRVAQIPYGETLTYGQVASQIGRPDRARAVGSAMARNPVAIVVPCHRVIGSDGSLTGYGGGLEMKRELLALEAGARQQALL